MIRIQRMSDLAEEQGALDAQGCQVCLVRTSFCCDTDAVPDDEKTSGRPLGDNVMRAVKRIREDQRLPYTELSDRLASLGRPIPVLGLRRIERGERRVDVDDLVALARALSVPPAVLLFPVGQADEVEVMPGLTIHPDLALRWFIGEEPPVNAKREIVEDVDLSRFERAALPIQLYGEERAAINDYINADHDVRNAEFTHGPKSEEAAAARQAYVKALDDFAHVLYRMVLAEVRPPAVGRSLLDEMVSLGLHIRGRGERNECDLTRYVQVIDDERGGE